MMAVVVASVVTSSVPPPHYLSPPATAHYDFARPGPAALCDVVPGGACLRVHNASCCNVSVVPGLGAVFRHGNFTRLEAPRSAVPRLAAIAGPRASVTVVAWLRPDQPTTPASSSGGFVGGLWDEADAARQYVDTAQCQWF